MSTVAYLSPGLQANAEEKLNLNEFILSVTKMLQITYHLICRNMHYILGDIKNPKCCTDIVYFTAPTSCVPLSRQNCIHIIRSNAKPRTGIQKVESVWLSAAVLVQQDPQTASAAAARGEMTRGTSSQLRAPTLAGRASSILLATGRICACSQCDWAHYPPQLIQPELPVWDASTPSLAPRNRAWCQEVEDLALAMEVAKNSEIWVWGKPWLLYNPPSEKQLKTPAELPSPKTSL